MEEERGRRGRWWIWPWVGLVAGSLLGGQLWSGRPPAEPSRRVTDEQLLRQYLEVARRIEESYVLAQDREVLTTGALDRMLSELDPHSRFFDPREFAEMQNEQNSKFYGVGLTIAQSGGRFYVVGVERGAPAERAGLRYGDELMAIDGESTSGLAQSDLLKTIRGEKGTEVEITVGRVGEAEMAAASLTRRIVREEVAYPSVTGQFMLGDGVGYIGLTGGFNIETTRELQEAIGVLKREGMEALVLDLRGNPGGLLTEATKVAETFLVKGKDIVSVRGREGGRSPRHDYRSENGAPEVMPLVLLIDGETASASEIVAGAMQDHGRAVLVGERSFGKGLVQTVFRLRSGTGLALTTARYYTPSGRSIQRDYVGGGRYGYGRPRRAGERDGGIEPEIVVRRPVESPQMRGACFTFARLVSAGVYPDLAVYRADRLRRTDFHLSGRLLGRFRRFLRLNPEWRVGEAGRRPGEGEEAIGRRLRAGLIAAAMGREVAERWLLSADRQVLRGLAEAVRLRRAGKLERHGKSLENRGKVL